MCILSRLHGSGLPKKLEEYRAAHAGSRMVLLSDAMQRCAAAECSTFGKQAAPNLANRGSINLYQRG